MAEARGVLVIGEVSAGQLSGTTKEVLAAGRPLAQQASTGLAVGLVGHNLASAAQEALQAGGDRVYTVDNALLAEGHPELYLAALVELCRTVAPDIILLGERRLDATSDHGWRVAWEWVYCRIACGSNAMLRVVGLPPHDRCTGAMYSPRRAVWRRHRSRRYVPKCMRLSHLR